MSRALPLRILGACLLLAVALVALVIAEDRARAAGREVTIAMEAVDPRDLLTGHYVALQLVQTLPPGAPCPPDLPVPGKMGWIALSPGAAGDRVTGGGATRAEALRHGPVVLRGQAGCDAPPPATEGEARPAAVRLELGVNRFHTDQAEAEAMDKALSARRPGARATAFAVISAGEDGRGRLKGVILNGRRTDLTWF